MKRKYLNKETATAKFKWEILTTDGNELLSPEGKRKLWKVYLYHLGELNLISKYSAKTWVYPEKDLKFKEK
jgi:hypothetical protein